MESVTLLGYALPLAALAGIAVLYERQARAGGDSARPRGIQRLLFYAGLVVLAIALASPMRPIADRELFTVHAVQHVLLTLMAPPLLIAGLAPGMVRPLAGPLLRALTPAPRAFVLFNVLLAVTHLPPVYAAGMASMPLRWALYAATIAAALLMWWPLLSPVAELPRLSYPLQMLYCFALSIPLSIVSVYVVSAGTPMYPYGEGPGRWAVDALSDQRVGGLIMWIPSAIFFYVVLSIVFWKWQLHGGAEDSVAAAQATPRPDPRPPLPQP